MDPISIEGVVAIVGLLIFNITALLISWKNTQVKLKELDMKIYSLKCEYERHVTWGEGEQIKNLNKFNELEIENKQDHKELGIKMDMIITNLNKFMLDILTNVKN